MILFISTILLLTDHLACQPCTAPRRALPQIDCRALSQRVAHACRIHSDLMSTINHIVPTVAELLEFRREERARQAQGWGRTAGLGGG